MIISRTPFRISFFGGGTDYPVWYKAHGGIVMSSTINKYCYLTVRKLPPFFDYKHRIRYYKNEEVGSLEEIEHPSVREISKFLNISDGIEVVHSADVPAQSGLGTSSTFSVGLLNALHALQNYMPTKRELALNAINIEQNIIGESVGSQDQVAASFGGFNKIEFSQDRVFDVAPIILSEDRLLDLQSKLLLCFTGFARSASSIASKQIEQTKNKYTELQSMTEIAHEAMNVLSNQRSQMDDFGKLLGKSWAIKKSLTSAISNGHIDDIYQAGINAGAIGGKLLGAGSGGFMLFYAPETCHNKIKETLNSKLFVPFRFESTGSKIIYFTHD
jgi:D-glycero-alpha-D-manno-heptose-7-phosphate kinase